MDQRRASSVSDTENNHQYHSHTPGDNNNEFIPQSEASGPSNFVTMMPNHNLQHVSSGIWSDISYDQYQHQEEVLYYNEAASSMENNEDPDSDYCDEDFNEENYESMEGEGRSDEIEDDEEENGEEEEESCEDDSDSSHTSDLVDDLQLKFQQLVFSTVRAAEEFLDHPTTLHLGVLNTCEDGANIFTYSKSLENTCKYQSPSVPLNDNQTETDKCFLSSPPVQRQDAEIQTDDDTFRSSSTLVPNDAAAKLKTEQIEVEISELEELAESLISELEQWTDLLEQGGKKTEEELSEAKRTICKIQESIEAVDRAIEIKSAMIAEAQGAAASDQSKEPEQEISQMVTNLEALSLQELQKLFGVYFEKAVELEYSSKELEEDLEKASSKRDDLNKRYSRKKEQIREVEEGHRMRILEFVCKNADPSYYSRFRRKEEQLAASKKRQQDLEKSLTALLVRHGYLLDGVDYDVKQVVRTLGIDESQLASVETKGRTTRRGGVQMSPVLDEMSGPSGEPSPSLLSPRKKALVGEQRDHKRYSGSSVPVPQDLAPPPEFEVTRERRRITIQPSTSSGIGGGAPSSSHRSTSRHSGGSSNPNKSNR